MTQHMTQQVHTRSRRVALHLALAAALFALTPSSALAITRDVVVSRGQEWVTIGVPYSQSSYYPNRDTGYRQDCSGFVSMAWQLTYTDGRPRSLATNTLPGVSERISADELQPGDIMLKPKVLDDQGRTVTSGHAVLFVGWVDPLVRTQYIAMEESGSQGKAVSRATPYPYWGPGYSPYRYLGIEEDYLDYLEPVRGISRYDTAVKASRSTFATGSVSAAVLCSGETWPDALGGSALAGALGGPVLLVQPDWAPSAVRYELTRLGVTTVYVVGGESAVRGAVVDDLTSRGFAVMRLAGGNRYETAALVASATVDALGRAGLPYDGVAYVASGAGFADAMSAAPVAYALRRPILLTPSGDLARPTSRALRSLSVRDAFVLGGKNAVSDTVLASVVDAVSGDVTRIAGTSRYGTALAIADHAVKAGLRYAGAGLATGEAFPDALAGGAAQGARGSVLLLTPSKYLHADVERLLRDNAAEVLRVRCYGGMNAVAEEVRAQVAAALGAQ